MKHRQFTNSDWAILPGAVMFADGSSSPFITDTFDARIGRRSLYACAAGDATGLYVWVWPREGSPDEDCWIRPLYGATPRSVSAALAALPSTLTEGDLQARGFKGGYHRLSATEVEARRAATGERDAYNREWKRLAPMWDDEFWEEIRRETAKDADARSFRDGLERIWKEAEAHLNKAKAKAEAGLLSSKARGSEAEIAAANDAIIAAGREAEAAFVPYITAMRERNGRLDAQKKQGDWRRRRAQADQAAEDRRVRNNILTLAGGFMFNDWWRDWRRRPAHLLDGLRHRHGR